MFIPRRREHRADADCRAIVLIGNDPVEKLRSDAWIDRTHEFHTAHLLYIEMSAGISGKQFGEHLHYADARNYGLFREMAAEDEMFRIEPEAIGSGPVLDIRGKEREETTT